MVPYAESSYWQVGLAAALSSLPSHTPVPRSLVCGSSEAAVFLALSADPLLPPPVPASLALGCVIQSLVAIPNRTTEVPMTHVMAVVFHPQCHGCGRLLQGWTSPYFNESHKRFRTAVRQFFDTEVGWLPSQVATGAYRVLHWHTQGLTQPFPPSWPQVVPEVAMWDELGKVPTQELYQKMGAAGILASRIGPGPHLSTPGITLPGGVRPEVRYLTVCGRMGAVAESWRVLYGLDNCGFLFDSLFDLVSAMQEFDFFHELIAHEEVARIGCPGFQDGIGAGLIIGLPPVLHFGTKALAAKVQPMPGLTGGFMAWVIVQGSRRGCLCCHFSLRNHTGKTPLPYPHCSGACWPSPGHATRASCLSSSTFQSLHSGPIEAEPPGCFCHCCILSCFVLGIPADAQ